MIEKGIVEGAPLVVYADTQANIEAAFSTPGMHAYATDIGRVGWYDAVFAVWRWNVVNLNDLANVSASSPSHGDILVYNAVTSSWVTTTGDIIYFTDLMDVPVTYTGAGGYGVVVKGAEDGLEFENLDGRYFRESEHIVISAGATDTGLPAVLDLTGKWDTSLIPGGALGTTTVTIPIALDFFIEQNQKWVEENAHGALLALATGQTLDNVTPINVTKGIGKIIIVVNAGADFNGTITVTGTTVDRNTGVETPADTDTLTIDQLTTDNSDTDAQGNVRNDFENAYITGKWFVDSVTLSTADLTLSDVDVYHCSYEQFNDQPDLILTTFDINCLTTNVNAWLYAYLYIVEVTGDKVDLSRVASLEIASGDAYANQYWRLRRGQIDQALDGSTDGVFVDLFLGPMNQTYFQDLTCKVWAVASEDITAANYLDDLLDVYVPSPNDGDVLMWDASTSQWIASTAVGGGAANYFTDLLDVPVSYVGEGRKIVQVTPAENGLRFVADIDLPAGGNRTVYVTPASAAVDGDDLTIQAGAGGAGNTDGGDAIINAGAGQGSGGDGHVYIGTVDTDQTRIATSIVVVGAEYTDIVGTGGIEVNAESATGLTISVAANLVNPFFAFRRARGSFGALTAVQSGDSLVQILGAGYDGAGWEYARARIYGQVAENWTATDQGTHWEFWTTPIGSTSPAKVFQIASAASYSLGSFGVGTASPNSIFSVVDESGGQIDFTRYVSGVGAANLALRKSRGTEVSPVVITAGDAIASYNAVAYDGSVFDNIGVLKFVAPSIAAGDISCEFQIQLNDTSGIIQTRMVIDENGYVGVGHAASDILLHLASTAVADGIHIDTYNTDGNYASKLALRKSHHNTLGTLATTQNGERLAQVYFDGVNDNVTPAFTHAGAIACFQDGAVGASSNYVPGVIAFYTSDGTASVLVGERMRINKVGNIGIGTASQFGAGVGVIGIANAGTNPSVNPTGGGVLYSDAGAGKWRGSGGTTTTFGPAEPHCEDCGRDFIVEWVNEKYGHLLVCMWCLVEHLEEQAPGKRKGLLKMVDKRQIRA